METKIALNLQVCLGQRSGVGTYAYELAKRMENEEGLTFFGEGFNFLGRNDHREMIRELKYPLYEQKLLPMSLYNRPQISEKISYNCLFPKADMTHFFDYVLPTKISGKVMTTIYDLTFKRYPETMQAWNRERIEREIQRSVERSDRILTISEFSKREIMELLHVPEEKIRTVYCAAPEIREGAPLEEIQKKYAIDRPYILFVGNIEPRKNLMRLLEAYEQINHREVQMVLCGGLGWNSDDIRRKAKDLSVICTGFVDECDKAALLQNAELLAYPSLYEGFGIPPLEAMQRGVPVVCSGTSSLPEVVGDAACIVDAFSSESIAQGLRKVLENSELRSELKKKGPERAKLFNWDRNAEVLKTIYREFK